MAEYSSQALNDAIRRALGEHNRLSFVMQTASLGVSAVDVDRALEIAADLEDQALVAKLRRGA